MIKILNFKLSWKPVEGGNLSDTNFKWMLSLLLYFIQRNKKRTYDKPVKWPPIRRIQWKKKTHLYILERKFSKLYWHIWTIEIRKKNSLTNYHEIFVFAHFVCKQIITNAQTEHVLCAKQMNCCKSTEMY